MSITLKNSPIVELIAEVRWDIPMQPLTGATIPGAPVGLVSHAADCEALFMRFTGHAFKSGFAQIERLVPNGFPLFAHQPVFRFRPSDGKGLLLQIGPGILTVNATPPYKTWDDFAPVIRQGLEALFAARTDTENKLPFRALNLRYIDGFNATLTQKLDIASFMSKILGIHVQLPSAITRHAFPGSVFKPSLQVQLPMADEQMMSLGIGEGLTNNEPAFVMDTTISLLRSTPPDIEEVMHELGKARQVIHGMFFELTAPILELMQPEGEGS